MTFERFRDPIQQKKFQPQPQKLIYRNLRLVYKIILDNSRVIEQHNSHGVFLHETTLL